MIYLEDTTEEGKRCEIQVKGQIIPCVVVCAFEHKNRNGLITRKYRLESMDKTIYDNIVPSEIKFKK